MDILKLFVLSSVVVLKFEILIFKEYPTDVTEGYVKKKIAGWKIAEAPR